MSKRGEEKRAEILSFMRGAYGALSAYDVLSGPRSTHPTIGLSTVYNALATLTESGVIHRVESRKADIVCQCGGTHQAFVLSICDACGTAEERDASQLLKNISGFFQIALQRERRPRSDLPPKAPSFITRVYGFGFHILHRQFGQARRARSPQIVQAHGALQRVFGFPAMSAV
jgi:Fur family zinc uptake transcriptional regulator